MKFEPEKVLTAFTRDRVKEGDWGWFADSPVQMQSRVGDVSKLNKLRTTQFHTDSFVNVNGLGFLFFYPADYEFMQKQWWCYD